MWNFGHIKIKHFYSRINHKMFENYLDATYFLQFLKAHSPTIFFLRNASTSIECKDVLKSLKKSENCFLGTSMCLVYDTIFKIYQKLFLKITNFILFQNSFPYPLSQFYSKVLCIILAHIKGILYFRNVLIFFERCESGSIFVRTPQKNISKLPF
jgi:hypothetical protein